MGDEHRAVPFFALTAGLAVFLLLVVATDTPSDDTLWEAGYCIMWLWLSVVYVAFTENSPKERRSFLRYNPFVLAAYPEKNGV